MQLTVHQPTSLVPASRPGLARRRGRHIGGTCQAFKTSRRAGSSPQRSRECLHVEVKPDGSDAWRLEPVAELLKNGAVGIIPTDSYPAFVCDLGSPQATLTLAKIKDVSPKKPMSILCRNFRDVDTYTMGWPVSTIAGLPDAFRLVKEIVPGCYTFILPASKNLPKVVTNPSKHRVKQRHTVGVRLPDSAVCQELLRLCDRPLLCTSVQVSELDRYEVADAATMMDEYAADINFIVDVGPFVAYPSTVVDMTGAVPEVLRIGKGDPSPFDPYHIL